MKTPIILLGGALAAMTALFAGQALADPAYATRNVNIRSGPGLNFETVDQLVADEPVDKGVCSADGSWCYVRHEGANGWVAAVFLTATPPGQPDSGGQNGSASSGDDYVAARTVNVRSGPGTGYAIVDRLDAGEAVTRGQCTADGNWCYVSHDGADGWVAASYLSPANSSPGGGSGNSAGGTTRIATAAVNIRTGPGTGYASVDRLTRGETVEVGQCNADGSWCYISHDGPDGWVSASFLAQPGGNSGGNSGGVSGDSTRIVTMAVNIRSGPGTNYSVVDRLSRGETVALDQCNSDGSWCYVLRNGPDGWVASRFLAEPDQPGSGNQGSGNNWPGNNWPGTPTRIGTAVSSMPVRAAPTLFTSTVGHLNRGDTIPVTECSDDGYWCHVVSNSIDGWVPSGFLQIRNTNGGVFNPGGNSSNPGSTPQPQPQPQPQAPTPLRQAITAEDVSVRAGPGDNFPEIGTLGPGNNVAVLQCGPAGNWCQINYRLEKGWLKASALQAPLGTPSFDNQDPPNSVCITGFGGVKLCFSP